jgi:hypothetical protein
MNADAGFTTFRKWSWEGLDAMMIQVARHVQMGLYQLISVSASKHSFVVVCVSNKKIEDFPVVG